MAPPHDLPVLPRLRGRDGVDVARARARIDAAGTWSEAVDAAIVDGGLSGEEISEGMGVGCDVVMSWHPGRSSVPEVAFAGAETFLRDLVAGVERSEA